MAGPDKAPEFGASYIREQYERGLRSIREEMHDYWINHAYLEGHQWLFYNSVTQRLDEYPRDPDRVQATVNRMRANTRTMMSKFMQRMMPLEVTPSEADDATVRGARIAESALRSIANDHGWERLRELAGYAVWKGATAAISVDWNPTKGEMIGQSNGKPVYRGDTEETVLSIAEFVVEPGARDAETARWWVKARALPPAEVQATYGLDKLPAADVTAGMTPFQAKLMTTGLGSGMSDENTNLTLVLTYYERPNHLAPKGRVAVVVGDELVGGGVKDWPFPWKDRLNLAVMTETPRENRWTGTTILTQAVPIQTAYNASWSSIIEHMKLAGNARLFIPQSAFDLMEQLTDLPGEFVPYPDGIQPPQWQAPPQLPSWVIMQPEKLAMELDDIMGIQDVNRGAAPVNIESGYGLSILAEEGSSPITRLLKEAVQAWAKVGKMVLLLNEKMVTDTRKAVIRTPGQPAETVSWTGKDFAGQVEVSIPLDAVLPRSRAAMMAMADKLLQMGVITSFDQYARVIELPDQLHLTEAINPDIARARWENAMLAQGQPMIPFEVDDHGIHMNEHRTFMKSIRFFQLPEELKQAYYDHVQAHETMMAQTVARMRARAMLDPALAAMPDRTGAPPIPPEMLTVAQGMGSGMMPGDAEGEEPEENEPAEPAE